MKKRILSLLLVLLMLLSALPMTALAGADGCVVQQRVSSPRDGQTYQMKLNEKDVGSFTFTKNGSGWSIRNDEGKYLCVKDGKLSLSGRASTAWTYRNGALSTTVSEKAAPVRSVLGLIASLLRGSTAKAVTKTYYLSTVRAGEKLSSFFTYATLYKEVSTSHDYRYVSRKNGTHDRICKKCGEKTNEPCVYDQKGNTCVCSAVDPSKIGVKIGVNVTSQKVVLGRLYTAKIGVEAKGVKAKLVEYSVNGGRCWIPGLSYSSFCPITRLKVRVLDSMGQWHYYDYSDDQPDEPDVPGENTLTIGDILPDDFPTSKENAWKNEAGLSCYVGDNAIEEGKKSLWFYGIPAGANGNLTSAGFSLDSSVSEEEGQYSYTCAPVDVTIVFHVSAGKLISIEFIEHSDNDYALFNGIYEPILTLADILPDDFPTSAGPLWKGGRGQYSYKEGEDLLFVCVADLTYVCRIRSIVTVARNGENYVYADDKATITFVLSDEKLTAIQYHSDVSDYSRHNATYTPRNNEAETLTIGDILPDDFPTTLFLEVPEDAWKAGYDQFCYVYEGIIWFHLGMSGPGAYIEEPVVESEGNYVYSEEGQTITFFMVEGTLDRIEYCNEDEPRFNGVYTPPTAVQEDSAPEIIVPMIEDIPPEDDQELSGGRVPGDSVPEDGIEILTVPEDNGGPIGFIPTAEATVPEEEAPAESTVIEEELPAEPSPENSTDAPFEEQPRPAAAEEETVSAAPAEEAVREQTEAE